MNLIVMVGISGSGKSTIAKSMEDNNTVILSADKIRETLYGNDAIQGNGDLVFNILFKQIHVAFNMGYNVIIDNTNVTREARKYLLDIAKKYSAFPMAILIDCSVDRAMRNQEKRERKVPLEVVQRQYNRLQESKADLQKEFPFVTMALYDWECHFGVLRLCENDHI